VIYVAVLHGLVLHFVAGDDLILSPLLRGHL